jgi:multidrug efflux pump subunit AcrA (membrane-fusion protein)
MKHYLLPVLAAGAALFATVSVVRTQPVREVTEPVSAPLASSFTDTVAAVGLIEASTEHISVGTPLSGVVTEVLVTLNQSVRAGTPLFRLDTRALQASLAVHESQLTAARARQATAQCQVEDLNDRLERSLKLRSSTVISEDELIRTRFALKVSQARVVEAQAEVAVAEASAASVRTEIARSTIPTVAAMSAYPRIAPRREFARPAARICRCCCSTKAAWWAGSSRKTVFVRPRSRFAANTWACMAASRRAYAPCSSTPATPMPARVQMV